MKALSNEKIVETVRWKEGEWAIHINHKDNGVQPALTGNGAISWEFVKDWIE